MFKSSSSQDCWCEGCGRKFTLAYSRKRHLDNREACRAVVARLGLELQLGGDCEKPEGDDV